MSTPESDSPNEQQELLRSIAASLKGIQSSLENLTGAVEGVAESIEKAHEPEGDLGVHLVGALKDLTSSLHKRAQQERTPQQRQNIPQHPQQNRRDDRPQQKLELRPRQEHPFQDIQHPQEHPESQENNPSESRDDSPDTKSHEEAFTEQPKNSQGTRTPKPRPNRNRRGNRGKQPSVSPAPQPAPSSTSTE